ncbi:hypothetical protein DYB32_010149 [Aphanomyces invadans]|uniref:Chromo domain-containing protein n=1 Tax=Aphanomyces invadans TaxID=157072 RepID=A0A3R6ZHH2_9STRA|nr:hypothetical protein DYB32_010149 [Aphanomyces invadans]
MFATADLEVTQDLLEHIAYVEGGHIVEALLDCKFDRTRKDWIILTKWMGLDELENSWEPLCQLFEDVPQLVHAYVQSNANSNSNAKKMRVAVMELSKTT